MENGICFVVGLVLGVFVGVSVASLVFYWAECDIDKQH